MEFKFRAIDDRPPITPAFFSQHAFEARPEHPRNEALQREIEKRRIREEIIAGGIARRRELEAEVWRELEMEGLPMDIDPLASLPANFVINELPLLEYHSGAAHPLVSEGVAPENNKDNLIVLAKPDPSHYGGKRRAASPPVGGTGELPFAGIKKKPKEEWNCALCQVSATCEKILNQHFQGKKHRAKEAAIRALNAAKGVINVQQAKGLGTTQMPNGPDRKMEVKQQVGGENTELALQHDQCDAGLKEKKKATQRERRMPEFKVKKPFKYWCQMCHVGAYVGCVMDSHERGKKHLFLLQQHGRNGKTAPNITVKVLLGNSENAEDTTIENVEDSAVQDVWENVETEKAVVHESTTENVLYAEDPTVGEEAVIKVFQKVSENKEMKKATTNDSAAKNVRKNKKFRFWCQMCQVGAYSTSVMESHRKGKKHLFLLKKHSQNVKTAPNIMVKVSSAGNETAGDATIEKGEDSTAEADIKMFQDVSENVGTEKAAASEITIKNVPEAEDSTAVEEKGIKIVQDVLGNKEMETSDANGSTTANVPGPEDSAGTELAVMKIVHVLENKEKEDTAATESTIEKVAHSDLGGLTGVSKCGSGMVSFHLATHN